MFREYDYNIIYSVVLKSSAVDNTSLENYSIYKINLKNDEILLD